MKQPPFSRMNYKLILLLIREALHCNSIKIHLQEDFDIKFSIIVAYSSLWQPLMNQLGSCAITYDYLLHALHRSGCSRDCKSVDTLSHRSFLQTTHITVGNWNKHEKTDCPTEKNLDSNLFIRCITLPFSYNKKNYNVGSLLPQQIVKKCLYQGN